MEEENLSPKDNATVNVEPSAENQDKEKGNEVEVVSTEPTTEGREESDDDSESNMEEQKAKSIDEDKPQEGEDDKKEDSDNKEEEDGSEADKKEKKKKRKSKDKKEKKDKKDKKEKRKKKKKEKSEKEELIQQLRSDVFGSSDEEGETQNKEADFDMDDDDLESKSKNILNKLVSKKKEEKSKKKRAREEKKKTKSPRKKKSEEGGDSQVEDKEAENPVELEEEEQEVPAKKQKSDFDEIIDSLKAGRRSRKSKADEDSPEYENMAHSFITKMEKAADDDIYENQQKRPALHKVKLLQEVYNQLGKKHLQGYFVEGGVYSVLRKWLDPLPDKSLPNIKVRECVLEMLSQLPTPSFETLKDSGIGKSVMILSKHSQETLSNKKICKLLIEKWSRPIFGISTKYKDSENLEEEAVTERALTSRQKELSIASPLDLDAELDKKIRSVTKETSSVHARIPEKMALDFKVRPKSSVEVKETSKGKVPKRNFDKMKPKNTKTSAKKVSRAIQMSIEGKRSGLFV